MALLERVSTLLRANINDLIERAEDPEKLAKQLVLDMENQLLQVKTQVAIAIADQHLLQKKRKEHETAATEWHRKAELAVDKGQDDLARAALERALSSQALAEGFTQQLEDQTTETENLRGAFQRLQQKLTETRTATELLISRNRRARAIQKAQSTSVANPAATLGRLRTTIQQVESGNAAQQALLADPGLNARFESMERDDKVEALLADLKSRQQNRLLQ
ncbi:phage shock protein A (PspA) family protein [Granulicella pectinivorans]|uniref:Phage shock protein A (PspA) family protein n=1 Tax=Granulicella pectinivorans TaxID=474950 RepID=A0A1I6LIT1_9BACT|nr:PspA/IM30 family protein [Granulicella pectinivorans]SFS03268.1 phage shock protein A (PspA) family protein [Granulicella pectinivorans]